MRPCSSVLGSLGLVCLAACSSDDALKRFTPADADGRARAYLAALATGQVDSALARLTPPLQTPAARPELEKVAAMLAAAHADSMKVVGAYTNAWSGGRRVNLTYELYAARSWLLANVATIDSGGSWAVEGVSARPLARPLEEGARFRLAGQPPSRYVWLLVTMLCAALSIGTAIFIASRRRMPARWRWVLASLVGVGAYSLNWATGETGMRLVNVQLFSAAALRSGPYAPWVITFAFPLGAVLALRKYRIWRVRPGGRSDDAPAPAPAEAAV